MPLEFKVNSTRALRLEYATMDTDVLPNVIGGHSVNFVDSGMAGAVIGGGERNRIFADWGTISGGGHCTIDTGDDFGAIAGGFDHWAGFRGFVGGGEMNHSQGDFSVVAGGFYNNTTLAGGGGDYSVIGGGYQNDAPVFFATVPGGQLNVAGGYYSFAAGRRAKVRTAAQVGGHDEDGDEGTFIWADSQDADVTSTGTNQFIVRASGNMWLGTSSSPSFTSGRFINTSTGAYLTTGGTWNNSSDRHAKENLQPVNVHDVLERVAELPLTRWNFKTEGPGIRHLGSMAQDFHAAFGLGDGETAIGTLDADGVALAAVPGLRHAIVEVECDLAEIESANRALETRIRALETALTQITASNSFQRRPSP